eukprot:2483935-Amphidinium_carterae.1
MSHDVPWQGMLVVLAVPTADLAKQHQERLKDDYLQHIGDANIVLLRAGLNWRATLSRLHPVRNLVVGTADLVVMGSRKEIPPATRLVTSYDLN